MSLYSRSSCYCLPDHHVYVFLIIMSLSSWSSCHCLPAPILLSSPPWPHLTRSISVSGVVMFLFSPLLLVKLPDPASSRFPPGLHVRVQPQMQMQMQVQVHMCRGMCKYRCRICFGGGFGCKVLKGFAEWTPFASARKVQDNGNLFYRSCLKTHDLKLGHFERQCGNPTFFQTKLDGVGPVDNRPSTD